MNFFSVISSNFIIDDCCIHIDIEFKFQYLFDYGYESRDNMLFEMLNAKQCKVCVCVCIGTIKLSYILDSRCEKIELILHHFRRIRNGKRLVDWFFFSSSSSNQHLTKTEYVYQIYIYVYRERRLYTASAVGTLLNSK